MNTKDLSKASSGNWKCAPDWINIGLGILLLIIGVALTGMNTGLTVTFALLLVASAIWDMAKPSVISVGAQGVAAFLIFILPWVGGFVGSGGSWLSWTIAVMALICAIWAWAAHPTE